MACGLALLLGATLLATAPAHAEQRKCGAGLQVFGNCDFPFVGLPLKVAGTSTGYASAVTVQLYTAYQTVTQPPQLLLSCDIQAGPGPTSCSATSFAPPPPGTTTLTCVAFGLSVTTGSAGTYQCSSGLPS